MTEAGRGGPQSATEQTAGPLKTSRWDSGTLTRRRSSGQRSKGGTVVGAVPSGGLWASWPRLRFTSSTVQIGGRERAVEHGHKQTPAASLSPSPRTLRQPCQERGPAWAWRINMSLRGQAAGPLEPRTAESCKQSLFSWPQTLAYLSALGISTLSAIKKGQAGVGALGEGW